MKNDKTPYFENFPFCGDLYIKDVYLEFENIPVLFTCYNALNKHFLCMCSEIRGVQKWTVAQVDKETIKDMSYRKLSIYDAFKRTVTGDIFLISYTRQGVTSTEIKRFKDVGEYELPTQDVYL